MTNAVERMMEEYGVIKTLRCKECGAKEFGGLGLCAECNCKAKYPPFTAEKQIELIKLISKIIGYEELGKDLNYFTSAYDEQIENALGRIVVEYKDELDTAKVKEILER